MVGQQCSSRSTDLLFYDLEYGSSNNFIYNVILLYIFCYLNAAQCKTAVDARLVHSLVLLVML